MSDYTNPLVRLLTEGEIADRQAKGRPTCGRCPQPIVYLASYERPAGRVIRSWLCPVHAEAWARRHGVRVPPRPATSADDALGQPECQHCGAPICEFGGVWFADGGGSTCHRVSSPDRQHRPAWVPIPEPRRGRPAPRKPAVEVRRRSLLLALAAVIRQARPAPPPQLTDYAAPLPDSVIARCADTASTHAVSTHGTYSRRRWE